MWRSVQKLQAPMFVCAVRLLAASLQLGGIVPAALAAACDQRAWMIAWLIYCS
jgi:hypothetical protein